MKKLSLILVILALLTVTGCKDNKKNLYLPEAKNDNIYTTIGGEDEKKTQAETEFCLISESTIIELNSDLSELLMKPTHVEKGSGDGFKWTDNKYEDVEIRAQISDDNKSIINKISTESAVYETTRGIKVGDNTKKLKELYKEYLTYSESIERKYYVYDPDNDIGFKRIFFYVENDVINKIIIEDGIDG
ncbi:MAG: hypothetical protein E7265_11980 [Lachnospiraceae bacterium]|nr:hypothetical protein [Lachnospiraceae bacterium]